MICEIKESDETLSFRRILFSEQVSSRTFVEGVKGEKTFTVKLLLDFLIITVDY